MTVEQQLRAALRDETGPVTGWADPVSRVEHGVRRRKRRRWVVRATAAATVLVTALTYGLVQRQQPDTPAIIDATVDDVVGVPFLQRRSPRPEAAACLTDRVTEVDWIVQSAPWGLSTGFGIRPGRDTRCTLSGRPRLFGVDTATGQRVEVPFAAVPPAAENGTPRQFPATIDGGEMARVEIRGSSDCPTGQSLRSYRDLSLLVDGRQLTLPSFRTLTDVCGAQVSEWFVEPPMEYASLDAYVEAPRTLRRGEDFSYTVRIHNAFSRRFALSGCPVYLFGLGAEGRIWRRLQCRISSIGGHQSVRFQLTGHIPTDTKLGPAKLTWIAALPNGEVIVADMQTSGYPVTITD
jgi:hypothetical protein